MERIGEAKNESPIAKTDTRPGAVAAVSSLAQLAAGKTGILIIASRTRDSWIIDH
jgi:hypothetical protein